MVQRRVDATTDTTVPRNDPTVVRARQRTHSLADPGSGGPTSARPRVGGDLGWLWVLGGLVLLLLLAAFLIPVFYRTRSGEGEPRLLPSDVAENPREFAGQTVTITGEVQDIVGPRAFTLGDEGFLFGEGREGLLVVGAQGRASTAGRPFDEIFREGELVRVTGPVRRFNLAEFEREIGFDLEDDQFTGWEGRPAIVARRILDVIKPDRAGPAPQ